MKTIKVVILGEKAIGKTWLVSTYTTNENPGEYLTTLFNNFSKEIDYKNEIYNLSIWDTAGTNDINKIDSVSYQQADVFIVCYAIDNSSSFSTATHMIGDLKKYDVPIILCGLRSDKRDERLVDAEFARKTSETAGCYSFIETSAVEFTNLNQLFILAIEATMTLNRNQETKCCNIFYCCK